MDTLTHGVKRPETGDKGNVFFPALEDNMDILNDHDHDGTDSAAISVANLTKSSQSILAAAWAATSGGTYRQEVTMPAGFTFANTQITHSIASGAGTAGDRLFLTMELGTASNKYWVYVNEPLLALTALYV